MLYFVKNATLHRYPVPRRCGVRYEGEALGDTIPHEVEECAFCLRFWPGDEE